MVFFGRPIAERICVILKKGIVDRECQGEVFGDGSAIELVDNGVTMDRIRLFRVSSFALATGVRWQERRF